MASFHGLVGLGYKDRTRVPLHRVEEERSTGCWAFFGCKVRREIRCHTFETTPNNEGKGDDRGGMKKHIYHTTQFSRSAD